MGKKLTDLNFTNRLYNECPFLFSRVVPQPLKEPKFIHVNSGLMDRMGLTLELISNPTFLRFCNADLEFEGVLNAATVYSGHQFGHYVPQLGDGRALMIAEVQTESNFFELQYKGSGHTPFSRMGDGRAVVRSSIREYLASAHLKALNIPTTEALSVIQGSDDVYREQVEKGAIVIRVAESFLRFGHYQFVANDAVKLKALVDFTIDHYFSDYKDHSNKYVLFFQDVVKKTAKLFARWQSVGFAHGVLNTDNTSILGLTIDYGPFGFIDNLDMDFICNHSDHEGRYSFGNQPPIGLWNLSRLADALTSLISHEDLERTLTTYAGIFHMEYLALLRAKCGLLKSEGVDEELMRELLNTMVRIKCDYTQFFRSLSHYEVSSFKLAGIIPSDELTSWLKKYDARLVLENSDQKNRHLNMLATNPKFILRNYLAQIAIEDHSLMHDLFKVLTNPFDEWNEFEAWSQPAPPAFQSLSVSCSS